MTSSTIKSNPQIVIIGAGFAGLAAASTLLKYGLENIIILEAMDREGGRIHTVKPFGPNVIELGAHWIHGQKGNPLYTMAKEHRLLSEDSLHIKMCLPGSVTPHDYFFNEKSKLLPAKTVDEVCDYFRNLMSKAFNQNFDSRYSSWNVGDYLDQEFHSSDLSDSQDACAVYEWCKRSECTDEACTSMYEFSLRQLGTYVALEGGFFNCLGPGGYQSILDILLKSIPSRVFLCGKPVHCVHWTASPNPASSNSSQPVRVVCADGDEFEADHVIVTVSLGYLKRESLRMFDPALPAEKVNAIESLGFGNVSKIYLEFEERFWPADCTGIQLVWEKGPENKEVYSALKNIEAWKKVWFKKICGFHIVARHDNVLCGWITGREAEYMEGLPEEEVRNVCARLLRSFTGWRVPNPRRILRSAWCKNPYIQGSYTYIPVGVDAVKEQEALAEPLPQSDGSVSVKPLQVLFAGEATHVNFYTTTHGAYLSGVREAERILNHYRQKIPHKL